MKQKIETPEELAERLCEFCPLDEGSKGNHLYPTGHASCEGCRCEEAYEHYLEEMEEEQKNIRLIP